jgi:hypothetical protein
MVFRDISLMEVIHSVLIRILSLIVIKVCSVTTNSFHLSRYNHTNDVLNQVFTNANGDCTAMWAAYQLKNCDLVLRTYSSYVIKDMGHNSI